MSPQRLPQPDSVLGSPGRAGTPADADHSHPSIAGFVLIGSQTLGGATPSVSFGLNDIRQAILIWQARGDTAATNVEVRVRFNGDSAVHYYWAVTGDGAGVVNATNVADTFAPIGDCAAATAPADQAGSGEFVIADTQSAFRVHGSGHNVWEGDGNIHIRTRGISYGPGPVSLASMLIYPAAGNFVAASTFFLYGR